MRQTKKAAARILRIAVYPGHLWKGDKKLWLNPTIPVTIDTPPTFLLEAENDPVDEVYHALAYYMALKEAKVPAELHLYAEGGYGFGLRRTKSPITGWPERRTTSFLPARLGSPKAAR